MKKLKTDMGAATEGKSRSQPKGGDDAKKGKKAKTKTWSDVAKGLKIENELETANSDKSGNESEAADSVRMFNSKMWNQLKAKWKKGQRKWRQHHDNKGAEKGRTSEQSHRKGRDVWNRTSRGAGVRRETRRSRSKEPEEQVEPQVELEGEC